MLQLITTKEHEPDYQSGTVIEVDSRDARPLAPVLDCGEEVGV